MIDPLNRLVWRLPVDSITIERGGVTVCLSDAMRRVAALAVSMEEMLAKAYAEQIPEEHRASTPGADFVLGLWIKITSDQIVPKDAPDQEPELPPGDESGDG
jgi:hypothetical protein